MDKKMMNTVYEFEFQDGSKANLTLAFYALYMLRSKNKNLYTRYNEIMGRMEKHFDELDSITLLYVAYVCANMENEEIMSEEEFLIKCGSDRKAVSEAARALTQPKKQTASAPRS